MYGGMISMMESSSITFSGQTIGEEHPCFIIAEACDNHLGDMKKAKEMVVQSQKAGADAVKFQHHIAEAEMLPDIPMSDNFNEHLFDFLKKYALTIKQHQELKTFSEEKVGITYMCTPFSYQAAKELNEIGVSSFKIGSGEMTDLHSLERIADFSKPMVVSTGMCDWEEIDRTYEALIAKNVPLALLNCVSEYPPVYEDINLDAIIVMKDRYPKAVIGHSDHTPDLYTSFAAVTLGASLIEKHVILDKAQSGPDQSVSINFEELGELVDGIRKIESARGSDRKVHYKEAPVRAWAFRYVVAEKKLESGKIITEAMIEAGDIGTKRTGKPEGIRSHEIREIIGATVLKDIEPNSPIFWEDLRLDK